jgi:quaternary ammonium compound-resistance protein SugE
MSATVAWAALLLAGLLDVAWAVSMKLAAGYTRPGWSILSLMLLAAFVYLLGRALEAIPVGTAYAIWSGIGAVGAAILGWLWFSEALGPQRVLGIVLVLAGIVALRLPPA